MDNIKRHPDCRMRSANGNCSPMGGFCTSNTKESCEAMQSAYWAGHNYFMIEMANKKETLSTERIGRWIVERYCSECEWDKKDAELVCNIPTNYCPNCGAKMEE